MKKNFIFSMIIALLWSSMIFSGCGKDKNAKTSSENASEAEVQSEENEPTSDEDSEKELEQTSNSIKEESLASNSLKAYQDFINGKGDVYFDKYKNPSERLDYYTYQDYEETLLPEKEYSFQDFITTLITSSGYNYDTEISLDSIKYAYIDCGRDDIFELLTETTFVVDYDYITLVSVFKLIDDRLQCIFMNNYAYRTFGYMTENGIYISQGANSAVSGGSTYYYIDADSNLNFYYQVETYLEVYGLYIPDKDDYITVAENLDIADKIEITQYILSDTNYDEYTELLENSMWTYSAMDDLYRVIDNDMTIYKPDSKYRQFWDSTGLPLNTEGEIKKAFEEKKKSLGITDEIENAQDAVLLDVSNNIFSQIEDALPKPDPVYPIVLERPSWDYYYYGYEAEPTTYISLTETSKKSNDIIDDYIWYDNLGISGQDRLYFSNGDYTFSLYGEDDMGYKWYPYMMDIYDYYTDDLLYTLDFSNYYKPDYIAQGDNQFVEESIGYAIIEDNILYVSTYHNTYSSSAPENAYITAIDMEDDFKVLWRTEPLTCNSTNFVIVDDAIICGYGFTNEDDYVYVLDKGCGLRTHQYRVKTSPEIFYADGDTLYVRCYDTDYEFRISQ